MSIENQLTNPMRTIKVHSVVLNISVGSSEEKLEGAAKILEKLTGQKPSYRRAKKTIKEFKIKKGEPIACIVTLRGKKAEEILDKALEAVNRRIKAESFTDRGNFSFGIKEYIDIPGMIYDPSIGILGMDVCVNLARAGWRVKQRRVKASKIGKNHLVTKEEAIEFMKEKFKVEII
ncbi:MAG: 50S ribosomal protein L5 [Thermoproteota archaeon]|jgi:large subunit ribosomal protein L5|nr:50S ribosomal protein L5 [Thermoproteota archaeon]